MTHLFTIPIPIGSPTSSPLRTSVRRAILSRTEQPLPGWVCRGLRLRIDDDGKKVAVSEVDAARAMMGDGPLIISLLRAGYRIRLEMDLVESVFCEYILEDGTGTEQLRLVVQVMWGPYRVGTPFARSVLNSMGTSHFMTFVSAEIPEPGCEDEAADQSSPVAGEEKGNNEDDDGAELSSIVFSSWDEDEDWWTTRWLEAVMPVPELSYGEFAAIWGRLGAVRREAKNQAMIAARRCAPRSSEQDTEDSDAKRKDLAA